MLKSEDADVAPPVPAVVLAPLLVWLSTALLADSEEDWEGGVSLGGTVSDSVLIEDLPELYPDACAVIVAYPSSPVGWK